MKIQTVFFAIANGVRLSGPVTRLFRHRRLQPLNRLSSFAAMLELSSVDPVRSGPSFRPLTRSGNSGAQELRLGRQTEIAPLCAQILAQEVGKAA